MKVLHVVEGFSAEYGGLSRAVAGLANAQVSQELSVEILTTARKNERLLTVPGVHIQTFRRGILGGWIGSRGLASVANESVAWADIIHIHGLWRYPQFHVSRLAASLGKPYVVSPHGMLDAWAMRQKRLFKKIYGRLVERQTLKQASALHALTEQEASDLRRINADESLFVIPNGVDLLEFQHLPEGAVFLRRYPALAGKQIVLFLGRMHQKKGLDLLARSFCKVASLRANVVLVIAGPDEGRYSSVVQSLLRHVPEDRVLFTGILHDNDRLAALSAANMFVLPSYSEGFPLAVVEAMAAGLPVVLTEACNVEDVAEAGAGFIVSPDAEALCKAMLLLIDAPSQAKAMGQQGLALASSRYSWDKIAAQMMDIYAALITLGRVP